MIVNLRFGWGAASHGPEFMGVFIFLLAKYAAMDPAALRASAREAGLKVGAAKPKRRVCQVKATIDRRIR